MPRRPRAELAEAVCVCINYASQATAPSFTAHAATEDSSQSSKRGIGLCVRRSVGLAECGTRRRLVNCDCPPVSHRGAPSDRLGEVVKVMRSSSPPGLLRKPRLSRSHHIVLAFQREDGEGEEEDLWRRLCPPCSPRGHTFHLADCDRDARADAHLNTDVANQASRWMSESSPMELAHQITDPPSFSRDPCRPP